MIQATMASCGHGQRDLAECGSDGVICASGVVAGEDDGRSPDDRTEGVPEDEPPVGHASVSDHGGNDGAQDADEPSDENGFGPMARHGSVPTFFAHEGSQATGPEEGPRRRPIS